MFDVIIMVLIFSEETDLSTDRVIDWLNFYGADYLRINEYDLIEYSFLGINNNNAKLIIKNRIIDAHNLTSIWHRRDTASYKLKYKDDVVKFLQREYNSYNNFLYTIF